MSGSQYKWFKLNTALAVITFNHHLLIEMSVDHTAHLHVRSECFSGVYLGFRLHSISEFTLLTVSALTVEL